MTELICVIVNFGLGSRIIKAARRHGITGGTITLGQGTVNSRILDFIGISDIRKEIVYMAASRKTAYQALEELNKEFEFDKPHHGIAFSTHLENIWGAHSIENENKREIQCEERGADNIMYHMINIIVDKGKAEDVITAANKAGSKGATVINARGSGIHERSKLFAMEIEPEKEIVIILSEADKTDQIVSAIRDAMQIDEPGRGIIFVQNVNKTYGIRQ